MRRINEKDYEFFKIQADGWSLTMSDFRSVLREWNNISVPATFYGIKPNGELSIIDTFKMNNNDN